MKAAPPVTIQTIVLGMMGTGCHLAGMLPMLRESIEVVYETAAEMVAEGEDPGMVRSVLWPHCDVHESTAYEVVSDRCRAAVELAIAGRPLGDACPDDPAAFVGPIVDAMDARYLAAGVTPDAVAGLRAAFLEGFEIGTAAASAPTLGLPFESDFCMSGPFG